MSKLWYKILIVILAVLVVAAAAAVIFTIVNPVDPGFTEFYLLDASGSVNEYPKDVHAGDNVTVNAVIINQERRTVDYRLALKVGDDNATTLANLSLTPGEKWQQRVSFVPPKITPEEKIEFLLFKNDQSEAYRELHLWLNVESRTTSP